jgi:hypothetical protein
MLPANFHYPYRFPTTVRENQVDDISDLQREVVQKVIRTNSRWKLARILEFVRRTLEQE